MMELVQKVAEAIKRAGGRAFLVGGCVRDEIMGLPIKDVDVEVYYLDPAELKKILEEFGKVDAVGASFAVYKLGQDIDVSIPRRESKQGVGHKGFVVQGDPYMSFEEACSRRDFTINAIMKDALTGEIVDPFCGQHDIQLGVLRMVSPVSFQEDSLRVLRLVQFAARFDFVIEIETFLAAREVDLSDLPKERIWAEIEKLLLRGKNLVTGLEYLDLILNKQLFPSLVMNADIAKQVTKARHFTNDLYQAEKLIVLLATMLQSSPPNALQELGMMDKVITKHVEQVVKVVRMVGMYPEYMTDYKLQRLAEETRLKLVSRVLYGMGIPFAEKFAQEIERLGIEDKAPEPVLKGRHLIEAGWTPVPQFGKVLSRVYDMQLKGAIRDLDHALAVGNRMMQEDVYEQS